MPDETTTAPPAEAPETPAPSADAAGESDEQQTPSDWFRETALGLTTRPLEVTDRKRQWDDANAELKRGRRTKAAAPVPDGEDPKAEEKPSEPPASRPERDEREFERQVQAEVDRREAVRAQRAESQRERELRQTNPTEYARLKEQQEQANAVNSNVSNALKSLATMFDDNTVTPLVQALDEKTRETVLKDAGHGMDGRKVIVDRAIKALKKASYDDGFAKGKAEAQKSLRKSNAFRKELLSELRDGEEEPDLAPSNGSADRSDWDMNDWMRAAVGRGSGR